MPAQYGAKVTHLRIVFAIVALSIACLTTTVQAAAFRHVRYDGGGDSASVQRMDIYTPVRPGPNPVLMVYDPADDDAAARVDLRVFGAAGYVVAHVRTRADDASATRDLASALVWLRGHVSSYGGDRERMTLLVGGAAATRAVRVLTDPPLAASGSGARIVQSLILVDPQGLAQQRGTWQPALETATDFPPVLALYDATQSTGREQALGFAARVAARGWSARTQSWHGDDTTLEAPVAARSERVAAWLASLEVPRIARYDALMFAPAPTPADTPAQLLGADGVLIARGSTHAGRLLALTAPDGAWRIERDFAAQGLLVRWIGTLPLNRALLSVALLEGADAYYLSQRDAQSGHWSNPRRVLDAMPGAAAPSLMAEPATQQWQLVLDQHVLRLVDEARSQSWRARDAAPVGNGRIVATAAGVHASFVLVDEPRGAMLHARMPNATSWQVWAQWPGVQARALSAVATDAAEYVLVAFDGGRVARVPTDAPNQAQWEFDATLALRAHWGAGGGAVGVTANRFEALTQPRTGERVHVLALDTATPAGSGLAANAQTYLIRQSDGSYALGMLDPGAGEVGTRVTQWLATPFAADRGAALYALRAGAAVMRGALRERAPTHGLWRRRDHPEQGLVLEPSSEGWLALLYSFDDDGAPAWYFAQGVLDASSFVANDQGLARYVSSWDETAAVRRDAERSGSIRIDFDAISCATESTSSRSAAVSLMLGGVAVQWCVDAVRGSGSDAATLAANGVWFGGIGDQGWGLAIDAEGDVGAARERVLLFYHDAQGEPRWAAGEGARTAQRSELALWHLHGACATCSERAKSAPDYAGSVRHDIAAYCGVREGRLDVSLSQYGDAAPFRRLGAGIQRLTRAACY